MIGDLMDELRARLYGNGKWVALGAAAVIAVVVGTALALGEDEPEDGLGNADDATAIEGETIAGETDAGEPGARESDRGSREDDRERGKRSAAGPEPDTSTTAAKPGSGKPGSAAGGTSDARPSDGKPVDKPQGGTADLEPGAKPPKKGGGDGDAPPDRGDPDVSSGPDRGNPNVDSGPDRGD